MRMAEICHVYLDKVLGNLLAVFQHPDWRNDPVPLDPDNTLAWISPWIKNLRMQVSLIVMRFSGAPYLWEAATV